MKYKVKGKFVIIALHTPEKDATHSGNIRYCRLKGIFGSAETLTRHKTAKISPNTLTTLLVSTQKHADNITKLKTGTEITIQGYIDSDNKHYHPVYVDAFLN